MGINNFKVLNMGLAIHDIHKHARVGQRWEAITSSGLAAVTILDIHRDYHYIVGYRNEHGFLLKEKLTSLRMVSPVGGELSLKLMMEGRNF